MNESDMKNLSFETQVIHAGHSFDPATNSLASPLYQTATFGFGTVEDMDSAWDKLGYLYTREGNPTLIELEEKLKAMEGGESALTASSGLGIITSTLYAILEKGDHLLCSKGLFFHSNILMNDFLAKMCIDVSFADFKDLNDVQQKIQSNTKAFFIETPTNPKLGVVDIQAVAEIAKSNDCIFIVDSTFAPPPIQRPLSLGADLVVHSLTKYINGHGDSLGGCVMGRKELLAQIKEISMVNFGGILSPFNAWLIARGLVTLPLRMAQHSKVALAVATFLEQHPDVRFVWYPGLESHPQHERAKQWMHGQYSGMIAFDIHGDALRHQKFLDALSLVTHAVSLGDVESLIVYYDEYSDKLPHYPEIFQKGFFRFSIGLESETDLIADLKQALERSASV